VEHAPDILRQLAIIFLLGIRHRDHESLNVRRLRGRAFFHDRREATIDHALPVKRHGIGFGAHARVAVHRGSDRSHAGIAGRLVGPFDPAERDGFVVLGLDRTVKVGLLAVRHIFAPAFHYTDCTMFQENRIAKLGMGDELVLVRGRHCQDETVEIAHGYSPAVAGDFGALAAKGASCAAIAAAKAGRSVHRST